MYCKPAIATISLGQPKHHDIRKKLREIARHGFRAVELFFDDLEALAGSMAPVQGRPASRELMLDAARVVRDLCRSLQLTVLNLQPFRFYEGLLDRSETARLQDEVLPTWLEVAGILGTDTILVASNFLGPDPATGKARTTGAVDVLVEDLAVLAARGARCSPPVRIAYEAIAWGDHVRTWQQAWDLVQRVGRPNFGLALDTFNLAAVAYADPTTESGKLGNSDAVAAASLRASLASLLAAVDVSRVFVVQIADGERLSGPLTRGHPFYVAGQPSRMSWSRNARLFLCEADRGGYLPVLEIVRCLVGNLGWEGYLSFEVFSRTLSDASPETPTAHAVRASRSWDELAETLAQSGVIIEGRSAGMRYLEAKDEKVVGGEAAVEIVEVFE